MHKRWNDENERTVWLAAFATWVTYTASTPRSGSQLTHDRLTRGHAVERANRAVTMFRALQRQRAPK